MENYFSKFNMKDIIRQIVEGKDMFDKSPDYNKIVYNFSKQTLASDDKLRELIINAENSKIDALRAAIDALKMEIDGDKYKINNESEEMEDSEPIIKFDIELADTGEIVSGFKIMIGEDNFPKIEVSIVSLSFQSKKKTSEYASNLVSIVKEANNEWFKDIVNLKNSIKKRNNYISNIYKGVENIIKEMSYVEVAFAKIILSENYKGIK